MKNIAPCKSAKNHCAIWVFRCFRIVVSLFLYFNTDNFPVTFVWIKEKANAKGNGDWHLRNSRFCKIVMRGFLSFTIWACFALVPADSFCFSARVCGEKILNMQWGFLFHELPAICHEKDLCVFYCGPFCKTVRVSLLVISAAIQKERKDRGRSFRVGVYHLLSMWFNSSPRRSRSATRCA